MARQVDVDDIVGAAEIAERLGLARATTINQWSRRHATFPRPLKVLKAGGLWDWREIQEWARSTGRLGREV